LALLSLVSCPWFLVKMPDTRQIEIQLLLEGIYQKYGYDFREYARASLVRRLEKCMDAYQLSSVSELQGKVLHNAEWMDRLLGYLSVAVTEFFRDPPFFRQIREQVVPFLKTYPFIRVWHAGSASGEEVYSLAIILHEAGVLEKCRIYATDFNPEILETARSGIYPLRHMKIFTRNYIQAGGEKSFSDYYTAQYDHVVFNSGIKKNIVFARHNLVTDESFNEFNLILCRNVMIYFNRELREKTHRVLYDSLAQWGILGLGHKESLALTPYEARYEILNTQFNLFKKIN